MCLSKSLGGGMPLGATTLSTAEIMSWPPGTHANTFGGNLLAAAAGLATLEFMEDHKLGEKAVEKGKYLMKRLKEIQGGHRIVGDVRGIGLMIGVELVNEGKEPAEKECESTIRKAPDGGLILLPAGDSVIRFVPPLIISREEMDRGLEIFERVLKNEMINSSSNAECVAQSLRSRKNRG